MSDQLADSRRSQLGSMAIRALCGAILTASTTFLLLFAFSGFKSDFEWNSLLAMTAFAMNIGAATGAVQGSRGPRVSFWLCSFYVVFFTFLVLAGAFAFLQEPMRVAAPLFETPRTIVLMMAPWLAVIGTGLLVPQSRLEPPPSAPQKLRRKLTPDWERDKS